MLNLVKIVVAIVGCLIVADIVGVVACVVLDIMQFGTLSAVVPYTVWFVLGVFTGLFAYNTAGGWTAADVQNKKEWFEQPGASQRGTLVVGIGVIVLVALGFLFNTLFWRRGVAGEYYVPDSASHTIVFFATVGASMLLFRFALTPIKRAGPPTKRGRKRDG